MTKKILWVVVSGLMALSLLIAACGPAAVEEEQKVEEKQVPVIVEEKKQEVVVEKKTEAPADNLKKVTLTKLDGTTIEKLVEKPKYGGELTYYMTTDTTQFDTALHPQPGQSPMPNSVLLGGDGIRGPAGTNETGWIRGNIMGYVGLLRNELAESWEYLDDTTIRFKIKQGVRFALNPKSEASRLVGGREVTAADVAWSFERQWNSPRSYHYVNLPNERLISAKAIDKYTVDLKSDANAQGTQILQTAGRIPIIAREVVEKYGNLSDWRNSVGSGPFMLTEYVASSTRTLLRNPNYFEKDPWFPENQLPYLDAIELLIIPDRSTQMAAMRTAKIDFVTDLSAEESLQFKKSHPEIVQIKVVNQSFSIAGNMELPNVPWGPQDDPKALKVRRALNMAINKQEIVDTYYSGEAIIFPVPWPPTADFSGIYRPLETYSQDVQELFQYKPEKAKQLLKEAGYPNGFKTVITTPATDVDFLSIIKDYWSKVGVEITLEVKDTVVMQNLENSKSFPALVYRSVREAGMPWKLNSVRKESVWNYSYFEHPVTREAYNQIQRYLCKDDAKIAEALNSISDVYLESAWGVWFPMPYTFPAWWPWLHRYDGTFNLGVWRSGAENGFVYWTWIDTALKKSMGH